MKAREKIIVPIISVMIIVMIGLTAFYPSLFEYYCRKRTDTEMANNFQTIYSGNIGVITVKQHDGINGYSAGASGVIFSKENSRYYALTAYHVVKEKDNYLVQTTNSETLSEYNESHPDRDKSSLEEYYNTKIVATLEYTCEESDLAIISFESDEDLAVIPISDGLPKKMIKLWLSVI